MSVYKLPKPWVYNDKWFIFPNTTLSNLNLNDCNDTVDGICRHTNNMDECISICENDPEKLCDGGYFIKTPDKRNFCVPLRNYQDGDTNPYYRLRNDSYYPQLRNVDSTFFISKQYSYPPDRANTLFFNDHFILRSVGTGKWLGVEDENTTSETVIFTKKTPLHVQLLPIKITRSYVENYVSVKNGYHVAINIPHTAFILRKTELGNEVKWLMRASTVNVPNNTFQIYSYNPNKKDNDVLDYSEKFYFTYFGGVMHYSEESKRLEITNKNLKDALLDDLHVLFELIPKVEVHYCDDKKCRSIDLSLTQRKGVKARYKGSMVSRSPECWSMCGSNSNGWSVVIITVILLLVVVVFVIYKFK